MPKPARALKAIAKQKDVKRKQDDDEDLSEDLSGGEFAVDEAAEREAFDRAMAEVTRKKEGKKRKHRARNDSSDEEDGIELDPREIEIVRQLRAQRGVGLGAGAGSDEDEDKEDEDEESGLSSQAPKRQKHMMNVPAIQQKLDEIALSPELPWVERLSVVNNQAPLPIEDPHDDLKREATFYQRTLRDVKQAIVQMDSLNMNYKRPSDFFAEMVKSDSHMAKIKDSLIFEKKKMEAALERKRQRDIKKYSKQVHSAKVQERAKQKREDLDAIAKWRKDHKKQNGEAGLERAAAATGGAEDDFPLALESDEKEQKRGRTPSKSPAKPNNSKRRAKDKKYGFGGKKSLKKQNDSKSVNDLSTFSVKKNKSSQGFAPDKFQRGKSPNGKSPARRAAKGGARPGKSKRAQSHGQKRK